MNSPAVKKLTYTAILIVAFSFFAAFLYQIYSHNILIIKAYETKYVENKNALNLLKKMQEEVLFSVASSIGDDPHLKEAIVKNSEDKAYKIVQKKWEKFKHIFNLSEIHIIKNDGKSFVNFIDYGGGEIKEKENYYLLNFRKDIQKSIKTGEPVSSFFICRYFAGFRSIYPIVKDKKLIGVVSVGKKIENIIPVIKGELHKNSFIILDLKKLKECIKPQIIEKKIKGKISINNYLIVGSTGTHNKEFILKNLRNRFFTYDQDGKSFLFTVFPLVNFDGNTIGFMVIQNDVTYLASSFKRSIVNFIFAYGILLIGIIVSIMFFGRSLGRRLSNIEKITEKLANREFKILEQEFEEKENKIDDIQRLKNNILKMGKDLHNYIIEINKQMMKLSEETFTDPMLNVLNRRAFIQLGNTEIEKAKMRNIPLSIMVLDLDRFKYINDTYGHAIGDKVLKDFVETVRKIISTRELFFRVGGEEFILLLPGADIKKAVEIGEKIRKSVEERKIKINGKTIGYTVSIGIAQMKPEDTDIYSLLHRADKMLYVAKRSGRNRIVY
ncbi:diguanylate cyclase [Persephonella sp.]|uniref:sensor domain-containing diguanylate cyclase n=1 Tax=Persephonella sp. TaxID=2060922 RepID=UPI0025FD3297|nr:diguanylate cyclase [Persephonella sp.]